MFALLQKEAALKINLNLPLNDNDARYSAQQKSAIDQKDVVLRRGGRGEEETGQPCRGRPVFVRRAQMLADFLFGRKLMLSIVPDENALSGEKVVVQPEESSFLVVMMLFDVFEEMAVAATGDKIVLA